MALGIKRHVTGAEFRFDSFDHAEIVGRDFMIDVQRALSRCDEEHAGGCFEDIRVHAGADRKGLDDLARVDVHDGQQFVAAAYE